MEERKFDEITPRPILEYCYAHSKLMTGVLEKLESKTREHGQIKMMSGPYLGRFLSMMSRVIRPDYIVEVGGFTGYGTACLSQGLTESGTIVSIEKNPALEGFASDLFRELGIAERVEQKIGDALEILPGLEPGIDLVFIDAAKRQYIRYYELVLPLVRKGGVILADNTLWKGSLVSEPLDKLGEGLDAFNKHVSLDERVDNILLPIDDGIHFITKR